MVVPSQYGPLFDGAGVVGVGLTVTDVPVDAALLQPFAVTTTV
jgi:hypothetical protein